MVQWFNARWDISVEFGEVRPRETFFTHSPVYLDWEINSLMSDWFGHHAKWAKPNVHPITNAIVRAIPMDKTGAHSVSVVVSSHISAEANAVTTAALARSLLLANAVTLRSFTSRPDASAMRVRARSRSNDLYNCTTTSHRGTLIMVVNTVASSNDLGRNEAE